MIKTDQNQGLIDRGHQRRTVLVCNDSDYFLRHRLSIVKGLVAEGIDVLVVTGGRPIDQHVAEGFDYVNLPIERFSFNAVGDVKLFWQSIKSIMRFKPQSILLITLKPAIYAGIASILCRALVKSPHTVLILLPGLGRLMSPNSKLTGMAAGLSRTLSGLALKFIAARRNVKFCFETDHDRNHFTKTGIAPHDKTLVVRGAGVDETVYYPQANKKPSSRLRILFASRLLASKGLNNFLAAADHFKSNADIEFIVAGISDDHDPDQIRPDFLSALKTVTFLGEVSQMGELIRSCDLVCLPTIYGEGIPRILIEAAACGVAAIATDIDGCREIIVDGVTGTLIKGDRDEHLTQALCMAIMKYHANPKLLIEHGSAGHHHFTEGGFEEKKVVRAFVEQLSKS